MEFISMFMEFISFFQIPGGVQIRAQTYPERFELQVNYLKQKLLCSSDNRTLRRVEVQPILSLKHLLGSPIHLYPILAQELLLYTLLPV